MKMFPILEMDGKQEILTSFFICPFLSCGECLVKNAPCPKNREDEFCQRAEDAFA